MVWLRHENGRRIHTPIPKKAAVVIIGGGTLGMTWHDGASTVRIDEGGSEVQIAGKQYPIKARLALCGDPGGKIMRG
ncbi:hypothetical protein [Phaeobacter sp. J2-8]|uniref:hypothetical protein n=1 Tax=Phaeobacter sp. J2-8 TaxID=2931394 RepID=UPI001FD519DC|nr:hypothetical protein [Phaeobacter sp. J2-8]MCJ7873981.1 hypothetical protein [Phaeobacter sp. J2-8]